MDTNKAKGMLRVFIIIGNDEKIKNSCLINNQNIIKKEHLHLLREG